MQHPLNAHHVALGLLEQDCVIDVLKAQLGLVVGGLVLKEVSLKVVQFVVVLFVKEGL